ncbi:hypothetical protein RFF05_06895 [Bengtsoniella intestinalis]|uniref:hypothetical protein n=1 Tax=Bengtsoniella intestinalis TaxID=3073143 RepID=UPI00391FAB45
MRVRGDLSPNGAFTLEEQPKKPGYSLARFYENVEEFSETVDGLTISGYEYDEYKLELETVDGLSDAITENYNVYLSEAKLAEEEAYTIPTLKERVTQLETEKESLESQLTDTQLALCDVYELMLGG